VARGMSEKNLNLTSEKEHAIFTHSSESIVNITLWEKKLSGDKEAVYKMLEALLNELTEVKTQLMIAYRDNNKGIIEKIVKKLDRIFHC
jgi:hypothetical protein